MADDTPLKTLCHARSEWCYADVIMHNEAPWAFIRPPPLERMGHHHRCYTAAALAKASRAAAMVLSMCSSVWAVETNMHSNCEGAR